ncbi:MAG: Ig-like domain-containing protein [Clostridiales bacterium]|nr:Ig-like domain-containing protein [Clostridiales bacterium]
MKNHIKRVTAMLLAVIMIGGAAPFAGFLNIRSEAADYKLGDIIEYGTYPQSDVTAELGEVLDQQSGEWRSYGYYSGTGENYDGQMTASDYMRYKDVLYNGEKYRGVIFDDYRPHRSGYTLAADNSFQDDNNYFTDKVYWFKYDTIKWRVLDPSTGFIMCNSIIDSQAYNNYIVYADGKYWGDTNKTYYANNYAKSSIRLWLNIDFYNTAFSNEQKANIKMTTVNNDCWATLNGDASKKEYDAPLTSDKVFLLSWAEMTNSAYGFNSSESSPDAAKQLKISEYAICQGLWVYTNSGSAYNKVSDWRLRSPYESSNDTSGIDGNGRAHRSGGVSSTSGGICPALKLQELKSDLAGSEIGEPEHTHIYIAEETPPTCTERGYYTYVCDCGDSYVEYIDAKGHTEGKWVVTKQPTLTETGIKTLYCSVCGEALRTDVVPKLEPTVKSVQIDDIKVTYKKSAAINPVITCDPGTKYTVTYTSSNPKGVSVDNDGNANGLKTGSYSVTVTVIDSCGNTVTDTCTVKVKLTFWQVLIKIFLFGWIWY